MTDPDPWYQLVDADEPLSQGDLIFDCPLLAWRPDRIESVEEAQPDRLTDYAIAERADLIVVTQACDLEIHDGRRDVQHAVMCATEPVESFRQSWVATRERASQPVGRRSWEAYVDRVRKGFVWSLALVNKGQVDGVETPVRLVRLHDVHTLPLDFIESYIQLREQPRLRLRTPYAEHISQAFARFFMRIGLPTEVDLS